MDIKKEIETKITANNPEYISTHKKSCQSCLINTNKINFRIALNLHSKVYQRKLNTSRTITYAKEVGICNLKQNIISVKSCDNKIVHSQKLKQSTMMINMQITTTVVILNSA